MKMFFFSWTYGPLCDGTIFCILFFMEFLEEDGDALVKHIAPCYLSSL
jgi:hypothetical protein